MNRVQQNSKSLVLVQGVARCLLDLTGLPASSCGLLKMSTNMGWYFWNITIDTAKLRSILSILVRNSWGMWAISAQKRLFVKNSIRGRLQSFSSRVRETQFPSTFVPDLPTVGVVTFRQATKSAHPIHCNWSPWKSKFHFCYFYYLFNFWFTICLLFGFTLILFIKFSLIFWFAVWGFKRIIWKFFWSINHKKEKRSKCNFVDKI